ncbi:TraB/GumN family protein [Flavobacterium sp. DG1-102-2]|uniref:TraB/GumN family protein n=1 Tax=Flavobacterium sp. DG1-102-2 TaxID=3081663 RepID=UPI0029497972|nr:TraB/GumN family protein [Flavobacterium sp. DG1-102-2]MDV6170391.1 TraB/GumN family protein [Flavobacterium sp. DG1-102-2]
MKKLFITAAIAFCSFTVTAQALENSLLWKISGNGLSKPSYLYGTIHITCDATLDKNILNALDATKQLYLELDTDDPNMQAEMMGMVMMKDGKKISTLLSKEDYALVSEFVKANSGMPLSMMDTMKPFIVSAMVYPAMLGCPMQSFEGELAKVSAEQKEEVYGLETVSEQMDVFDVIPYEDQMKELVKMAKEGIDKSKGQFKLMMDAYARKDLNALMAMMNDAENPMYSDHNDVLLTNRNKNWIPKIEKAAEEKPTFFGVGAAHLAGDEGVIKLLRKKGYKVEAVK